ncbi:integrase [Pseudomonas putida]|uniref:integrase n=1 Tax=Pseudomonas putida TaxID=303 RepID=UPI00105A28BB|nr:integrase [Pseudomonas putida]TDJ76212.1 integrase [Pseudomonas putida]
MSLLTGFEFLDNPEAHTPDSFHSASWLKCEFHEEVWRIQTTQKNPITIDWRVGLWNGTVLTAPINEVLHRSLKHLLIMSVEGLTGEFSSLAPESKNHRLKCSMRAIDYLLIHAKDLQLLELGLGALDGDDIKNILNVLASSSNSENTIYNWRERCQSFFEEQLSAITKNEASDIFAKYPAMLLVGEDLLDEKELDFNAHEIPMLRAALMKSGFYYRNNQYALAINTKKLSTELYPDTLRGKDTKKTAFDILCFFPNDPLHKREYPAVIVTTGTLDQLQDSYFFYYRYFFTCTPALMQLSLPAPADVEILKNYKPVLAEAARFRSVPSETLLTLFRKSMEFHINHGRMILDGFISIAEYCVNNSMAMHNLSDDLVCSIIGNDLVQFGVKKLGLSALDATKNFKTRKPNSKNYCKKLRENNGLLELVHIYIGCVQLIVGMIMARRADELVTLKTARCLDKSLSWLIFEVAKSTKGALGLRQRESRPIDAIAVEMIEEVRRFQSELKRVGAINELGDLFSTPFLIGHNGLNNASRYQYNRCLDFACDYFETTVTLEGKRYYVRQHQLRRFFAIMFFYSNTFGDLDTLRWMLGHRDIEHVWRYLQECLSPREIRGAGARYFAEAAKKERLENYEDLKELLAAQFGTTRFSLIDEQEIQDYLDGVLEEKKASIDYEFFKDENGVSMRVLFIIHKDQRQQS